MNSGIHRSLERFQKDAIYANVVGKAREGRDRAGHLLTDSRSVHETATFEQFEEMAIPVANDLRSIGVYDDDDRVNVERLNAAVADWFLSAHTGFIGTNSLEAERPA